MAEVKKAKKNVKKSFFEAKIPLVSASVQLYAANAEELDGRVVKIDLTKFLRGKNFDYHAILKSVDGKLEGEPKGLYLVSSYVAKMMRGGADYAEDSFEVQCRDASARIKPLMITRNRVSRAVLRALRNEARAYLQSQLKTRSAREVFSDIMANKLQRELSLKLRKIYPLALCEIRVFEVTGARKEEPVEVKAEEKTEEAKEKKEKQTKVKKEKSEKKE